MTTATFNAWYFTNKTSIDLLSASTLEDNGLGGSVYIETAIKNLRKAADALGYTLERQPLNVMPTATFMDKINAATKTIPVSDLLHDEPGVQVDGSTTMGFR